MIRLLGIVVLAAFISPLLSELGFRGKRLFSVLILLLVFSSAASAVGDILGDSSSLFDAAGISSAASAALKTVGVGYLFGVASDIVSELGEPALAKGLITAGKMEILLIVFPYFKDIIELGVGLIK